VIGEWRLKGANLKLAVDSTVKPGAEVIHVVPPNHSWKDDQLVIRFNREATAQIVCAQDEACNSTDVFLVDLPGASIDVTALRRKAHEGLSDAEVLRQPIGLLSRNSGNSMREAVLRLVGETIPVAPMFRETVSEGIFLLICPSGPNRERMCPSLVTRTMLCPATARACAVPGGRPGIFWVSLHREAGEQFLPIDQEPALILVLKEDATGNSGEQEKVFHEEASRIANDFPTEEAAARSLRQGLIVALSRK
jgi:hypothetical protein